MDIQYCNTSKLAIIHLNIHNLYKPLTIQERNDGMFISIFLGYAVTFGSHSMAIARTYYAIII